MDTFDLRKWEHFKGKDPLIDQITIDSRLIESKNAIFVALPGTIHDGHSFVNDALKRGAKYVLVKKEYPDTHPSLIKVQNPLRSLQELAAIYRSEKKTDVIAITGSYGKTMVKDFLYFILKKKKQVTASPESFNSQIGVALSLLQISQTHEIALIEAGISEPGDMDHLLTMIKPTHSILTTTKDIPDILIKEKSKLLQSILKGNWLLFPNEPLLNLHLQTAQGNKLHWNNNFSSLPFAKQTSLSDRHLAFQITFPSKAVYNYLWSHPFPHAMDLINITLKASMLFGLKEEDIALAIKEYTPEPMQTEIWRSPLGTLFINDAYSADPMSVDLAIKKLNLFTNPSSGKKFFIFEGIRNEGSYSPMQAKKIAESIKDANLSLVLTGTGHDILMSLLNHPFNTYQTPEDAIHALYPHLTKEDTVLIQGPNKKHILDITDQFKDMPCNNHLTINLSHIESNLKTFKDTRVLCMVKANAYGTDPVILSKFLQKCGVDILGVAHPDEAIFLKRQNINTSIFVIHAALYELEKIVNWEFELAVSSLDTIQRLDTLAHTQNKKIKVHLHIDTGMSRLGCRETDALFLAKEIQNSQALILEGVMTHFACSDMEEHDAFTKSQVTRFRYCVDTLSKEGIHPKWIHAANSSGALRTFFPEGNMIRPGLALFGLVKSSLKPALSLSSRIVGINYCDAGDTISYGRNYLIKQNNAKIAVVPLGYFDGLHRHFSGKGHVLIKGQKAAMAGNICMDFMMVDVSHIEDVSVGDSVLIFGEDAHGNTISLEDVATRCGTNVHELITCMGPRIQRVFIEYEH
ncbi:MAG: alanine racemase [Chlamydiales bacterium]|nr:alanine racemase [Chlamydiales bacterium]